MSMAPCINPAKHHVREHVSGSAAHRECVNMKSAPSDSIEGLTEQIVHDREPVSMVTADGRNVTVTPGVIDEDAQRLFMQGQCLAFASEMSKKLGSNRVVAFVDTNDNTLVHAYAESRDGLKLYDIEGEHELDDEIERWDTYFNGGVPVERDEDDDFMEEERFVTEDIGIDPDLSYPADPYENPDDEMMSFLMQTNYLQGQNFTLAKPFADSMDKLL